MAKSIQVEEDRWEEDQKTWIRDKERNDGFQETRSQNNIEKLGRDAGMIGNVTMNDAPVCDTILDGRAIKTRGRDRAPPAWHPRRLPSVADAAS
jgi:hypothetical protein